MIETETDSAEGLFEDLNEAIQKDKYKSFSINLKQIMETIKNERSPTRIYHYLSEILAKVNYPTLLNNYSIDNLDEESGIVRDDFIPFFYQGMHVARIMGKRDTTLAGEAKIAFEAGYDEWSVYCNLEERMMGYKNSIKHPIEISNSTKEFTQPQIALLYYHLKSDERYLLRPQGDNSKSPLSMKEFTFLSGHTKPGSSKKQQEDLNTLMRDPMERTGCSENINASNRRRDNYIKIFTLLTDRNCIESLESLRKDFRAFGENYEDFHGTNPYDPYK